MSQPFNRAAGSVAASGPNQAMAATSDTVANPASPQRGEQAILFDQFVRPAFAQVAMRGTARLKAASLTVGFEKFALTAFDVEATLAP